VYKIVDFAPHFLHENIDNRVQHLQRHLPLLEGDCGHHRQNHGDQRKLDPAVLLQGVDLMNQFRQKFTDETLNNKFVKNVAAKFILIELKYVT
jgi:hypothetical protein